MGRRRRKQALRIDDCRRCGRCCETCGRVLAAEESDLARWRREGRQDLLARVGEGGALWLDPATGSFLNRCPFLERHTPDAATCSIHATKPDMCRAYPTIAHGFHCARGIRFTA